jgi:putative transposase
MYDWRKMSETERAKVLSERKSRKIAWHSLPHLKYEGDVRFIVTAACFEHQHIVGKSPERMAECESRLIETCQEFKVKLFAWCVLPNHYHLLIQTDDVRKFQIEGLGKFHGSSSFRWNGEDGTRGRKVWYESFERPMKSDRHFWASLNYVHHNAVKHRYVTRWQDWAYSSAQNYLNNVGKAKAAEIWREYPILDYGKDWDIE